MCSGGVTDGRGHRQERPLYRRDKHESSGRKT
nr:MAG TPA: hypothetical protein [Caudoviricetes sp.]